MQLTNDAYKRAVRNVRDTLRDAGLPDWAVERGVALWKQGNTLADVIAYLVPVAA